LRQIARDAGVSHGAPRRHFGGLPGLLAAVAAQAFDGLSASVSNHVGLAGTDPLDQLRAAGRGYVDFAIANPGSYELMFRPERLDQTDPEYVSASVAAFAQLAGLTAAAQATGWRADLPQPALTGVLWAGVHGIASLWIQGSLPAATNIVDRAQFLDIFQVDLALLPR
jgi:AcrR family transcriptional regulator